MLIRVTVQVFCNVDTVSWSNLTTYMAVCLMKGDDMVASSENDQFPLYINGTCMQITWTIKH